MRIFQVGGAVRDRLLGRPCVDVDWVVVGAKPEDLLARGFRQVGADFPVFLHPTTKEEFALARQERKAGHGHRAFLFDTENVTLEEDLSRRDLTINAMAMGSDSQLVDPFHGQQDLRDRCLRHVSEAFAEDPLRILRVLRFRASLGPAWHIHPDTVALMQQMVAAGEADHLTPERIWKETAKALLAPHPELFLGGLRAFGLLKRPPFAAYREARDRFPSLAPGAVHGPSLATRFALAFASLSHSKPFAGIPADVLRVSEHWAGALQERWLCEPHQDVASVLAFFTRVGLFKAGSCFDDVVAAARAVGVDTRPLEAAARRALAVDTQAITQGMPPGPAVGKAIQQARLAAVALVI